MVDVDGMVPRRILEGREDQSPFFACWSPDGARLAVDLFNVGKGDDGKPSIEGRHIEVMDADGTHRCRIELPHAEPIPLDWW